jgi:hypothetical protein
MFINKKQLEKEFETANFELKNVKKTSLTEAIAVLEEIQPFLKKGVAYFIIEIMIAVLKKIEDRIKNSEPKQKKNADSPITKTD